MTLIFGWKEKKLQCHFCGQTKSVRYALRLKGEDGQVNTVACCNKCVLKHMGDEADERT